MGQWCRFRPLSGTCCSSWRRCTHSRTSLSTSWSCRPNRGAVSQVGFAGAWAKEAASVARGAWGVLEAPPAELAAGKGALAASKAASMAGAAARTARMGGGGGGGKGERGGGGGRGVGGGWCSAVHKEARCVVWQQPVGRLAHVVEVLDQRILRRGREDVIVTVCGTTEPATLRALRCGEFWGC